MASTMAGLTVFDISTIFLSVTALLTYVNHRFINLPTTIGVVFSILVQGLSIAKVAKTLCSTDKPADI